MKQHHGKRRQRGARGVARIIKRRQHGISAA